MSAADIPLRAMFDKLKATVNTLVATITDTSSGITVTNFDTHADFLNASGDSFSIAYIANYNPGDGNKSLWIKATDVTLVPNGIDVVQLTDGTVVLRYFAREAFGSLPSIPSATPYSVSIPLSFETLTDFHNSTVSTPCVIVADANGQGKMWLKDVLNSETGTEDVDWIVNASGIHYRYI